MKKESLSNVYRDRAEHDKLLGTYHNERLLGRRWQERLLFTNQLLVLGGTSNTSSIDTCLVRVFLHKKRPCADGFDERDDTCNGPFSVCISSGLF